MHGTVLYTERPDHYPTVKNTEINIPIQHTEPKGGKRVQTSENLLQNPNLSLEKKWVLNEVCKMKLDNDQVSQALEYIENLPLSLMKEEMLQQTISFIIKDYTMQQPQTIVLPAKPVIERIDICVGDHINIEVIEDEDDEEANKVCCGICFRDVKAAFIKCPLPCACEHAYCHDCYTSFLYEKIAANQVLDIYCPEGTCTIKFEDEQVKLLLTDDVYEKYLQFKHTKELNQNPNVRWCIRPTCGKHIIAKKGSNKVVCECGMQICFTCRNEYHPNRTCEQMMDDNYKEYLVKNDVQKCPHCKSHVEKIDGCNHMSCSVCNYQWCWLCGDKYTLSHYEPMNPFGCAGLQRGGYTRNRWPRWRIRLYRATIVVMILIISFLVWPFASAALLSIHYYRYLKRRKRRGVRMNRVERFGAVGLMILLFLVGICILPVLMMVCLFFFMYNAYDEWKQNR